LELLHFLLKASHVLMQLVVVSNDETVLGSWFCDFHSSYHLKPRCL